MVNLVLVVVVVVVVVVVIVVAVVEAAAAVVVVGGRCSPRRTDNCTVTGTGQLASTGARLGYMEKGSPLRWDHPLSIPGHLPSALVPVAHLTLLSVLWLEAKLYF